MNMFTYTEMEMLTEYNYIGAFMEDIAEGDEIAIKRLSYCEGEPPIKFVTVSDLVKIPRFERDDHGHLLSDYPDYLMRFIAVHENGMREPMAWGAGHAIFRKDHEASTD